MNQMTFEDMQTRSLPLLAVRKGSQLTMPEGLNTTSCTHGVHRFPGKFVPEIPRFVYRHLLQGHKDRIVLDPFCGSGTTLVEAALEGRPFVGIDMDPMSALISKAKTTRLSGGELRDWAEYWRAHDFSEDHPELYPQVPNLSHWFSGRCVQELSSLKYHCNALPEPLKTVSLVLFSSIIRRVSNADDQTQKTYVSHTQPKSPPLPSVLFSIFLERAIKGYTEFLWRTSSAMPGVIIRGDARSFNDVTFHDVVTSPPYIDSIDYIYNQMLEYFWLLPELGVDTYANMQALRRSLLGMVGKAYKTGEVPFLDEQLGRIYESSPKEAAVAQTFFLEYSQHVRTIRKMQEPGSYYVSVVGNSVIRNVPIPTADVLSSIHQANGYTLIDRLEYDIRRHYMKFPRRSNSGKIMKDYILVFEAI